MVIFPGGAGGGFLQIRFHVAGFLESFQNHIERARCNGYFAGNGVGQLVAVFILAGQLGEDTELEDAFFELWIHTNTSLLSRS